jgi:hypothetical protein
MISLKRPHGWTNQSLATTGANLPSVNLKTDKKKFEMAAPGLKNKTSKWKSRITCFLFLQKKRRAEEETVK